MTRSAFLLVTLLTLSLLAGPSLCQAARPIDSLLPPATKGFLSVPDADRLQQDFDKTQLGALVNDPEIKAFVEDLVQQVESKLGRTGSRLGIKPEDLKGVYGGEVVLATIQPGGDAKEHALAMIVDVTGHAEQANQLLASVAEKMKANKAQRTSKTVQGVALTVFVLPKERGAADSERTVYLLHDNFLIAVDHEVAAQEILARLLDPNQKSLKDDVAYQATMARCRAAAGDAQPHLRWFVEPFGYVETLRASAGGRKKRGTDLLKVLANQGFSAIQGLGGYVEFATGDNELVHRTSIYAPPVNSTGERYNMAARMLNFPNSEEVAPPVWIPHQATNFLTLHFKMQEAFEYSKTLVDEVAGAPVFEDIMDSLKNDPHGPRVDIRQGLVRHLGERAMFFTDYRLPISTTSERWLLALEVKDAAAVKATLDKAMQADPDAKKREVGEYTVWEIIEQQTPAEVEELDIAGAGFGEFEEEEEEEEDTGPLLSHAAFTVGFGQLLVASHVDFIEEVVNHGAGQQTLDNTKDFVMIGHALTKIGAGADAVRYFTRTDKEYHTTYELIRTGKMPESETLLGSALNRLFGPDEKGVLREQQIQGDKMPDYEKVRTYLGPAGLYVQSEDNGWFVAGCLLKKPADGMEAAGPMVSRRGNDRR